MTVLTIATLFPLDTVAAGDEANGPALVRRARQRGIEARLTTVNRPEAMTPARIYLLGGDGLAGVVELVSHLRATDLVDRVRSGEAIALAVDAGLAAVGRAWTDRAGITHKGLGLVGTTALAASASAAGTITTRPAAALGLPALVGWRSDGFTVERDPGIGPFVEVLNGDPTAAPSFDGVLTPGVIATQIHGPVLALNPELADLVLTRALGLSGWDPLPIPSAETARARRIAELTSPPRPPRRGGPWARLRRA